MGLIIVSIAGLGSFVCWLMVLIKIFGDQDNGGAGKGILAIICGIYAFIWGWQQNEHHDIKGVMLGWTVCIGLSLIGNFIFGAELMSALEGF